MPTVATNGIRTHYERRGDGPPIVFVHGAAVDSRQWEPQLDALADGYTVVAYDVRGHGRTGGSAEQSYSVDLFAEDLAALIDALDLDRPIVCGHSTGGCIAQVHAARHAEDLGGLILADTFAPEILSRGEWLQRSLLLRATIPPTRLVGYERVERAMVWLQERVQGEAISGDYDAIRRLREEGPRMTTAEFAKVIRAVVDFADAEIDFGAITLPALVLYGENDAGFVRRHAERFGDALPDATVRSIPDAGHAANLDNSAAFTDAVRSYAAERSRGRDDAADAAGA